MPHITLEMYKGRSEELKKEVAEKTVAAVAEALGRDVSHFSLSIKEYEPENWQSQVMDKLDEKTLYVKPNH